ncbi:hypothetical protein GCM10026982_26250 [Nocardiopsis aegyptia]
MPPSSPPPAPPGPAPAPPAVHLAGTIRSFFRGHSRPRGRRAARYHRAPRSGHSPAPSSRGRPVRAAGHAPHPEDHMYDMVEYPSTPDSEDEVHRALQGALDRRDNGGPEGR